MDLSTYNFPKVTKVDLVFPTFNAPKELVDEAMQRLPLTKGKEIFWKLFFEGGEVSLKEDVNGTWKEEAFLYAKALMGSFNLSSEEKELICAMIFEECLVL